MPRIILQALYLQFVAYLLSFASLSTHAATNNQNLESESIGLAAMEEGVVFQPNVDHLPALDPGSDQEILSSYTRFLNALNTLKKAAGEEQLNLHLHLDLMERWLHILCVDSDFKQYFLRISSRSQLKDQIEMLTRHIECIKINLVRCSFKETLRNGGFCSILGVLSLPASAPLYALGIHFGKIEEKLAAGIGIIHLMSACICFSFTYRHFHQSFQNHAADHSQEFQSISQICGHLCASENAENMQIGSELHADLMLLLEQDPDSALPIYQAQNEPGHREQENFQREE